MAKKKRIKSEDPNDESSQPTEEAAAVDADMPGGQEPKGIGDIATETFNLNRKQLAELADEIRERTRQRPLKSLLVAGGAGVLIGILWG